MMETYWLLDHVNSTKPKNTNIENINNIENNESLLNKSTKLNSPSITVQSRIKTINDNNLKSGMYRNKYKL